MLQAVTKMCRDVVVGTCQLHTIRLPGKENSFYSRSKAEQREEGPTLRSACLYGSRSQAKVATLQVAMVYQVINRLEADRQENNNAILYARP